VATRIHDLSSSGIRFHAPTELPLLSRVQIALELPDASGSPAPIAITGVVVRCEQAPQADSAPFDTAIYFEDLSERAQAQLAQFLARHSA